MPRLSDVYWVSHSSGVNTNPCASHDFLKDDRLTTCNENLILTKQFIIWNFGSGILNCSIILNICSISEINMDSNFIPIRLLELIYYFTYFSTVVPSNICVFLSGRSFVVNTTFSRGLVGVEKTFLVFFYMQCVIVELLSLEDWDGQDV